MKTYAINEPNTIFVRSDYNEKLHDALKTVPKGSYNRFNGEWEFPETSRESLQKVLTNFGVTIADRKLQAKLFDILDNNCDNTTLSDVKNIIKEGANPAALVGEIDSSLKDSPLYMSLPVRYDDKKSCEKLEEITTLLLEAGADPNGGGATLNILKKSIRASSITIIKKLLEAGADPNGTEENRPILEVIVSERPDKGEILDLILSYHPTLTFDEPELCPYAEAAVAYPDMLQKLIDAGVDVNAINYIGTTPLQEAISCSEDERYGTFLHQQFKKSIQLLSAAGAKNQTPIPSTPRCSNCGRVLSRVRKHVCSILW